MAFWSIAALRTILDTETDADSPGSQELLSQIRENIEALLMLAFAVSAASTCTSDPSNDVNGYFYDTVPAWTDDLHNGRTLLITSGSGKGNMYTIDDTDDATDRLACTGDNLYADGVRSGDSYIILFDVKVNADGHDHDGINSKMAVMPFGRQLITNHDGFETNSTTYYSPVALSIYIPNNPTTVRLYARLKIANAVANAYMRFTITDSDSTVFISNSQNTNSITLVKQTISADLSTATSGHALLLIEALTDNASYAATISSATLYWDT